MVTFSPRRRVEEGPSGRRDRVEAAEVVKDLPAPVTSGALHRGEGIVGDAGVLHTLDEVRRGLGDDVLTGAVVGAHVAVGRGSSGHSGGSLT